MRVFLVCLLVSMWGCVTGEGSSSGELTDSTFDDAVYRSGKPAFLKFYAPWCGHCQMLAPAWDRLHNEYSDRLTVGKVNCDEETGLASRFDIRGFPMLKYIEKGSLAAVDYEGGRSYDSLKAFAEKLLKP
eukprot:Hpha_TRINITY_DN32184_c0_g1::TRINITY_DN32184_c0_g1_i1::g.18448::m.18448/K09584/PDIA6, TXNDC7; protein disulfide-isomerase A6